MNLSFQKKQCGCILSIIIILMFSADLFASEDSLVSNLNSWIVDHSISAEDQDLGDESEGEIPEDEVDESEKPITGRAPGMCQVPQQPALMRCEIGSGFLCVDTPPGGVSEDSVRIRGTIDRQGSVLASMRIAVQNEYTKKIGYVDTSKPDISGCWDEGYDTDGLCVDSSGRFSAKVMLERNGPHTISISASRLSGESMEKKIRTSRVVLPEFSKSNVTMEPDATAALTIDASMVTVTIDLLGECSFCDFIGASTGGLTASIKNSINDSNGDLKEISCVTTVEQGAQGRFVIGVPVNPGVNNFKIQVCNTAAKDDTCPTVMIPPFTVGGSISSLDIISPDSSPTYDLDEYPSIPWKFKLGGDISCMNMQFNREEPLELCADSAGLYSVELYPREGINIATLSSADNATQFTWTFGWGRVISPYSDTDGVMKIENALGVNLSSHMIESIFLPFINNFLASDELEGFIVGLVGNMFSADEVLSDENSGEVESPTSVSDISIPHCDEGGGLGNFITSLNGIPKFGDIVLENFSVDNEGMALSVAIDGLTVGIKMAPDKDEDGVADKEPLPLIISFSSLRLDLLIKTEVDPNGNPIVLISSPHSDCAYKGSDYCTHMPAAVIPRNFIGDANKWGYFVICDEKEAASSVKKVCKAFNSINAQTVVIGESVLDTINDIIYCGGSKAISKMASNYVSLPVEVGCAAGDDCEGVVKNMLPHMVMPVGVKLNDGIGFSADGISLNLGVSAGDTNYFKETPFEYHNAGSGLVVKRNSGGKLMSIAELKGKGVGASLSLDALSAILFAAASHGDGRDVRGLLDFDIHELFFNDIGFDFVEECDAFEPIPGVKDKLPTLCYIRPRVMDLLGSALTSYGYFSEKHPLIMAIRGSRALSPRLSIENPGEVSVVPRTGMDLGGTSETPTGNIVELQLGGVELSFYAIEVDKVKPLDLYGNLPMKLDSDGKPVIKSMRPEDPDPWNGAIVSFDVSMLLGLEISDIKADPDSATGYSIKLRTLADRSRLVITPIEGSNLTTIPSRRLISSLADQIMTAIAQFTPKESAISFPIPEEIAFEDAGEGLIQTFGLRKISFGSDGISLKFEETGNSISILIKAALEQFLHYDGEERLFTLQ